MRLALLPAQHVSSPHSSNHLTVCDADDTNPTPLPCIRHVDPYHVVLLSRNDSGISDISSGQYVTHENSDWPLFTIPVSSATTRSNFSGTGWSSSMVQRRHVTPLSALMLSTSGVRGPQLTGTGLYAATRRPSRMRATHWPGSQQLSHSIRPRQFLVAHQNCCSAATSRTPHSTSARSPWNQPAVSTHSSCACACAHAPGRSPIQQAVLLPRQRKSHPRLEEGVGCSRRAPIARPVSTRLQVSDAVRCPQRHPTARHWGASPPY